MHIYVYTCIQSRLIPKLNARRTGTIRLGPGGVLDGNGTRAGLLEVELTELGPPKWIQPDLVGQMVLG